jgi:hypothetical protein
MIIKYKTDKTREELIEIMKQAFANMGYNTPEKRKQWYEENCKSVAWICTRVDSDRM